MSRVTAEIDLNRLKANLPLPAAKIMGIVKADGYGHGAVEVAKTLEEAGVKFLGVASVDEGAALRSSGIQAAILVLTEPENSEIEQLLHHNLSTVVYSAEFINQLAEMAAKTQRRCQTHLKVDTGMGRVGCNPAETLTLAKLISEQPTLEQTGLLTHLSCATEPEHPLTKQQLKLFKNLIEQLEREQLLPPYVHLANNAAGVNYNLVRVGIALYKGVLTLKARVNLVKVVSADTPLSYGATFVTKQESKIATVTAGYADGVNRLLSNRGEVLIRGERYPIVGRVCMDMFMVDVTGSEVAKEDEVVIIGRQGSEQISAKDVAQQIGTIDYEVLCGITQRVERIYQR